MVARRNWTRKWWDLARQNDELFTSPAVIAELRRGNFPSKTDALNLIQDLSLLQINEPIIDIVQAYISHRLMPRNPEGDALHLALASYHRCDFLVTWNCQHLANANKFGHLRRVNAIMGLHIPNQVTPLELLGEELASP
jgi:predicted nucleic acid-binding protein